MVPVAPDEPVTTPGTASAVAFYIVNIACVHVVQALIEGDTAGP